MCRTAGRRCNRPGHGIDRVNKAEANKIKRVNDLEAAQQAYDEAIRRMDPLKIQRTEKRLVRAIDMNEKADVRVKAAYEALEKSTCYETLMREKAAEILEQGGSKREAQSYIAKADAARSERLMIGRAATADQATYTDVRTGRTFTGSNKTILNNLGAVRAYREKQPWTQNRSGQQGHVNNLSFTKYANDPDLAIKEGYDRLDEADRILQECAAIEAQARLNGYPKKGLKGRLAKENKHYAALKTEAGVLTREGNQRVLLGLAIKDMDAGNVQFETSIDGRAAAAANDTLALSKQDRIKTYAPGKNKSIRSVKLSGKREPVTALTDTTEVLLSINSNNGVERGASRIAIIEHPTKPGKCLIVEQVIGKQNNTGSNNYGGDMADRKRVAKFMSQHQDSGSNRGLVNRYIPHGEFRMGKNGTPSKAAMKAMNGLIKTRSRTAKEILFNNKLSEADKAYYLSETAGGVFFLASELKRGELLSSTRAQGQILQTYGHCGHVSNPTNEIRKIGF